MKQVFPIFLNPGGGPEAPLEGVFDCMELVIKLLLIDDSLFREELSIEFKWEKPIFFV